MDGHFSYNSGAAKVVKPAAPIKPADVPMADAAQVVQNITNNLAQVKEDAKQLQRLSDVVMGRKVQFNVNQELNQVVVSIVDPSTDKVIKEIPSQDLQKLKVRIRKTIGLLFDEMI
ncbi:MAG: flagellar protein FlaG [Treponema sp.]|nr:flagellar protein FlaG [Treponema sp.]MBQ8679953.1 flagellar protein FlaG [Treponema sp.]